VNRLEQSNRRSFAGLLPAPCACPEADGASQEIFVTRSWQERRVARRDTRSYVAPIKEPDQAAAPVAAERADLRNRSVFEAQVRPYLPQIYRVCLALCHDAVEAEDLLQNSLVKAYTGAESFQGRSDLFAWICGIVRNEHMEAVRTRLRRWSLLDTVMDGCAAVLGTLFTGGTEEPSPEERAIHSQRWETLLTCMRSLPEDYRMVVLLCDVEEFGYERVAEVLEIPIGTVKSRHARGRARLKEAFLEWESGMAAKEDQ
jgi:RNA polymerase sigma-70 factor, ECF subfamily